MKGTSSLFLKSTQSLLMLSPIRPALIALSQTTAEVGLMRPPNKRQTPNRVTYRGKLRSSVCKPSGRTETDTQFTAKYDQMTNHDHPKHSPAPTSASLQKKKPKKVSKKNAEEKK